MRNQDIVKEVILHIGTGKTGTSHIQDYLYRNRQCLARKHDLDYSRLGLKCTNHFGEVITAHYPVARWIVKQDEGSLLRLRQGIETSSCSRILFSCESFYHILARKHLEYLKRILQGFRVRVICYVRRQDLYIESAYRQQVKVGQLKAPFSEFLKTHTDREQLDQVHANYYKALRRWEEMFSRDAIVVRPFEKTSLYKGDLLEDFLHLCSLHGALKSCKSQPNVHNVALPRELIEVIRYFNSTGIVQSHQQQSFVEDLMRKMDFADGPMLTYTDRMRIIANYKDVNKKLFQRYIGEQEAFDESDLDSCKDDSVQAIDINQLLARLVVAAWEENIFNKHGAIDFVRRGLILADCVRNSWVGNGRQSMSKLYLMVRLAFSKNFVPEYYVHKNPDILRSGVNPLRHYMEHGFDEKRSPSPAIGKEMLRKLSSLYELLKVRGKA